MNCTALNENLLEDELFGHEPGAFTGADRLRKGRFEHANGGTLFLDEVGDMPLSLQAKLLRVLENQEVLRIGSNDPIKVNVRLLSATNRDLEAAVAEGSFPPGPVLSPQGGDGQAAAAARTPRGHPASGRPLPQGIQPTARQARHRRSPSRSARRWPRYDWPGNVRELRNLIESMVVQDSDGVLDLDDLQEGDTLRRLQLPDHAASRPGQPGRPAADRGRTLLHRADPGADRRQPRGSGARCSASASARCTA